MQHTKRISAVDIHVHGLDLAKTTEAGQRYLLSLIIHLTNTGTTSTTDSVDFVNEDEAGGVLGCLLEQVPHSAGPDSHKHLHKLRARAVEEWHSSLTSNRLEE